MVLGGGTAVTSEIVSIKAKGPGFKAPKVGGYLCESFIHNKGNKLPPSVLLRNYTDHCGSDVIMFVHDDVTIHSEDWHQQAMYKFLCAPNVGVVGFGGALGLGDPDLYKRPYDMQDMARVSYMSNQTDWHAHGQALYEPKRVAVLDAFFMAVRRDFLMAAGNWPTELTHHCLDLWLACEAARHKVETWIVPVSVTHHGGGTSTKKAYQDAKWVQGGSTEQDHIRPHRWIYNKYRDVLPLEVK